MALSSEGISEGRETSSILQAAQRTSSKSTGGE